MSEIRQLLSSAQQAELQGHLAEAIGWLRRAEAWYRQRRLLPRADQMVRQIRRLGGAVEEAPASAGLLEGAGGGLPLGPVVEEGGDEAFGFVALEVSGPALTLDGEVVERASGDEAFGFGAALDAPAPRRAPLAPGGAARAPGRADPALDAWCSFCCRPGAEVGPLAAGPAGAFICEGCVAVAGALLGGGADPAPAAGPGAARATPAPLPLLPGQQRALDRLRRRAPGLALLLGPTGSGKSTLLAHLGAGAPAVPGARGPLLLEAEGPLEEGEARRLLRWLDVGGGAVLATRGTAPAPALLLNSEDGLLPVHDTASLQAALPHLPEGVLARVELVVELPAPGAEALLAVARARLAAREVALPEEAVLRLVELALASPRGAHELAVLVARVPPGSYIPSR